MPKELSGIMLKTSISALLSCSTYLEMAFQKDVPKQHTEPLHCTVQVSLESLPHGFWVLQQGTT